MRLSQYFIPTVKEVPNDAVTKSHILMIRAGMISQLTAGVYSYLPFGFRVFNKIINIIRDEMNKIGGLEFQLPGLSPNELWVESGRFEIYGDDIFKVKNREMVLAPTHEEVFTTIAKSSLNSYKSLPQIWYQIHTKFRNEARPRGGVLRTREFTMKDAYSFDVDWDGLDVSYDKHAQAYRNIFTRLGLKFFSVKAHSGAMGGKDSEEFMVESDAGEDNVALSEDLKYASNMEVAVSYREPVARKDSNLAYEKFHTPNIKTIDELAEFVGTKDKSRLAKSRVFVNVVEKKGKKINEYILGLVCGDDEVNESKLSAIFGAGLRPANNDELPEISGANAGSIGPINLKTKDIKIIADLTLKDADELISGANEDDYHIKNIDFKRDVPSIEYHDIRTIKSGEETADRKQKIKVTKAIEVGHIFKLGLRFSEKLGAYYLDKNGKQQPIVMGSYGIGVQRSCAAYIEQNHDEKGIIWQGEIAPFHIHLICVNPKIEETKIFTDDLYSDLQNKGYEVLYDDRTNVGAGFKFNDADLLGMPVQVIVGDKNLKEGKLEVKLRKSGERFVVPFAELTVLLNTYKYLFESHKVVKDPYIHQT
jgi:prolyl-tRNA synthetase